MEVEVLLSTMNLKDIEEVRKLIEKMNIKTKILIINQITEDISIWEYEDDKIRIYSYKEKGLSKSRNKAIGKLNKDIGIIADDDIIYENNYEEIIKKAYQEYKDADIIAFYVYSDNKQRKIRKQRTHKVNFLTAMRIKSIQITFKEKFIKESNVRFKEEFGAGSKYFLGEENIFLYQCLKNKKKIYYVDKKIGNATFDNSTWFKGFTKDFFFSEGTAFYAISKKFYKILILQYAIRKRKEYKNNMSIKNAIKYMVEGANEYKNNERRS